MKTWLGNQTGSTAKMGIFFGMQTEWLMALSSFLICWIGVHFMQTEWLMAWSSFLICWIGVQFSGITRIYVIVWGSNSMPFSNCLIGPPFVDWVCGTHLLFVVAELYFCWWKKILPSFLLSCFQWEESWEKHAKYSTTFEAVAVRKGEGGALHETDMLEECCSCWVQDYWR